MVARVPSQQKKWNLSLGKKGKLKGGNVPRSHRIIVRQGALREQNRPIFVRYLQGEGLFNGNSIMKKRSAGHFRKGGAQAERRARHGVNDSSGGKA